jgi:hypothetical protein
MGYYFESRFEGCDGENFHYSVYTTEPPTEEKVGEIRAALDRQFAPLDDKDIYTGWQNVSLYDGKIWVSLDLGNVEPEYEDDCITGILDALNTVSGIETVVINEGMGEDFDFDYD